MPAFATWRTIEINIQWAICFDALAPESVHLEKWGDLQACNLNQLILEDRQLPWDSQIWNSNKVKINTGEILSLMYKWIAAVLQRQAYCKLHHHPRTPIVPWRYIV